MSGSLHNITDVAINYWRVTDSMRCVQMDNILNTYFHETEKFMDK